MPCMFVVSSHEHTVNIIYDWIETTIQIITIQERESIIKNIRIVYYLKQIDTFLNENMFVGA